MKAIKAGFEIMDPVEASYIYKRIEQAGRTCYKSESAITDESSERFVRNLIKRGHEAMLEHASITVKFTVDRGVSHELVRHRLASFAQESTRYCNYSKDKFGRELTFIKPCFFEEGTAKYSAWVDAMKLAESFYLSMIDYGATPQEARSVLPNSLKTEVVMTANIREWRHILNLRAAGVTGAPHPQMLEVMVPLLKEMKTKLPALFDDIQPMNLEKEENA